MYGWLSRPLSFHLLTRTSSTSSRQKCVFASETFSLNGCVSVYLCTRLFKAAISVENSREVKYDLYKRKKHVLKNEYHKHPTFLSFPSFASRFALSPQPSARAPSRGNGKTSRMSSLVGRMALDRTWDQGRVLGLSVQGQCLTPNSKIKIYQELFVHLKKYGSSRSARKWIDSHSKSSGLRGQESFPLKLWMCPRYTLRGEESKSEALITTTRSQTGRSTSISWRLPWDESATKWRPLQWLWVKKNYPRWTPKKTLKKEHRRASFIPKKGNHAVWSPCLEDLLILWTSDHETAALLGFSSQRTMSWSSKWGDKSFQPLSLK